MFSENSFEANPSMMINGILIAPKAELYLGIDVWGRYIIFWNVYDNEGFDLEFVFEKGTAYEEARYKYLNLIDLYRNDTRLKNKFVYI